MTDVHRLHEDVSFQQDSLTELALRGSGNYELSFLYREKGISAHAWTMLTYDKQQKCINSFKKSHPPSKPRYLIEQKTKNLNKVFQFGSSR